MLLDGEKLLHTRDAQAAMLEEGVALLAGWPSKSPDLTPQENVWAWAEDDLRKSERKRDIVAVAKRRMAKCVKLRGCKYLQIAQRLGRLRPLMLTKKKGIFFYFPRLEQWTVAEIN